MCGIAGILSLTEEPLLKDLLKRMCEVLRHRGPDDHGIFISKGPGASLCHTRLSIIDLVGGHQPMPNEDQTIWITYNGEIYNFEELRKLLIKKGHIFRTLSDTEVILHMYEEEGIQCVRYLRGMFAFAIWDEDKRSLYLARDRVGKKPLSYFWDGKRFIFASETKAILQHPEVPREPNLEALEPFLAFLYVPPELSMFKGIKKLPPAHWLHFKEGHIRTQRYWEPRPKLTDKPSKQLQQEITETLTESVKIRLVSDVPLGAFLSGGIDSSIVVGLMSKVSSERVKTFSVGFEESGYSELRYARLVAERFNTDHHEFIVRPNAVEILPKLIWHYDEPFGDSSSVPTYYVSKMTSQHVKVALSGDGGDELFAGYPRYQAIKYLRWLKKLPIVILEILGECGKILKTEGKALRALRLLKGLNMPLSDVYTDLVSTFKKEHRGKILLEDIPTHVCQPIVEGFERCKADPITAAGYTDLLTYLPHDLLTKVDIASMANSLEVRCPFLDHNVITLALKIPSNLKLKGTKTKYILKGAFKDLLPEPILKRGKMGFGVPLQIWFRGKLREFLCDVILSRSAYQRGYFKMGYVRRLVQEHLKGIADHSQRLWVLLNLELWHRTFIDAK
jgi:asparagine synthase (glutamine-hydrolysing)